MSDTIIFYGTPGHGHINPTLPIITWLVYKSYKVIYYATEEYRGVITDANADFSELCEYYYESAHRDQSGSKYLYASLQGGYLNMNINHGLKVIDKDIIIISGEDYFESDYVPEEYAELNDNIECISIMDTSYLPQLEAPAKVMDIIQEYWK